MHILQGNPNDPEAPKLICLTEGVFVRQEIDNIGWIDMGGYLVVVDALEQADLEEEVFGMLKRTVPDTPVRYVLNTHTHYDHVALNSAFQTRFGAEPVSAHTERIPAEGKWFEGKSRRIQMLPLPDCHTREDCVVWLPEDSILFVGDIFGWGLIPWDRSLDNAKWQHLLGTYRHLIQLGAETVVPGHGPICTNAELFRWIEYAEWLLAQAKAACANGTSDADIVGGKAIAPPADMHDWWRFCQWKHQDSLKKVLRAVRLGRL